MRKIRYAGNLFGALALALMASFAVPTVASAASTTSNSLSYEFDNGNFSLAAQQSWYWELQKNTAAINATIHDYGYADAGIVMDLGSASTFTGINAVTSGPMSINVWIGDGTDASTPGQYASANFSYGFEQPNGSFYMTSGNYEGQTLTAAQIATDFSNFEVYGWVGLVYSGVSISGSVSSVNGQFIGHRTVSFINDGNGTVTAALH